MSRSSNKPKATFTTAEWDFPVAATLLGLCLIHALWVASIGWNNTLNDHHSFRQTQTAITAYYLREGGFRFDYETPVLGKPWSIPMEFPIYQEMVAKASSIFHTPLDQTGRFFSFASFLLMLAPICLLLARFNVKMPHRLALLAIILTSPFYLFWSRTFLIETMVLFYCFAYLACVSLALEKKSRWLQVLAVLFGIAASLTKITTWLPFLGCAGLMILWDWVRWPLQFPGRDELRRKLPTLLVYCGIPFLFAFWWVKYSDRLKAIHPLAYINTAANSSKWNFGTLDQKLSGDVWSVIIGRACTVLGMPLPMWWLFFICVIVLGVTRRRWKEAGMCLFLFLLSPMVFTNLNYIHDYYMIANGVFLLGFFGFSVISLLEGKRTNIAGWAVLGAMLLTAFFGHSRIYLPVQQQPNEEIRKLADYVKSNTTSDGVIICLGFDWDPMVPYYSERRALMIPDWDTLTPSNVYNGLQSLRDCKVEALVVMEPHRYSLDLLQDQIKTLGYAPKLINVGGFPQR